MSHSSGSTSPRTQSNSNMESRDEKRKQRASNGLVAMTLNFIMLPLRVLPPLLSYFVPLVVFLLCIPLLMLLSGTAGWFVWKNVPVDWKAEAFLQYGDGSTPFANMILPPILADQPYDISLHLVVPTTESNYALGNFMATLRLTTAYNDSITTVRRPATLVPSRPSLARRLILGAPATAKLEVPLLAQFVSGTSAVNARLELGRSDAWKGIGDGQARELSVVAVTLRGRVRPKGVMALLARYPRLATFASTFMFFFVSLLVVCCVLFIVVRSDSSSQPTPHKGSSGSEEDGDGDDSPPRPRMDVRYAVQKTDNSNSTSGSGTPDEDKPRPPNGGGVRTSSLRKRRSTLSLEPVTTARVKIEDTHTRRGTSPPPYPKSPYPRPSVTGGDASSSHHIPVVDPMSSSDADAESS